MFALKGSDHSLLNNAMICSSQSLNTVQEHIGYRNVEMDLVSPYPVYLVFTGFASGDTCIMHAVLGSRERLSEYDIK